MAFGDSLISMNEIAAICEADRSREFSHQQNPALLAVVPFEDVALSGVVALQGFARRADGPLVRGVSQAKPLLELRSSYFFAGLPTGPGNGGKSSCFKKALCFAVAERMTFSISSSFSWVV